MRQGGCLRRLHRAAASLVVLTLLPVAALVAVPHAPSASALAWNVAWNPGTPQPEDMSLPAVEAMQRSQASNLFAAFSWDGMVASGPYVRFVNPTGSGTILDYSVVNGTLTTPLVESIQVNGEPAFGFPTVSGATFSLSTDNLLIVAHDEPMALLEIRTFARAQNLTIQLPEAATGLKVTHATVWPASTLSFTNGNDSGRLIIGRGNLWGSGTTLVASLTPGDYLALRAVPNFVEHPAERAAILEAFASGHLAAEFDLVAMAGGGWLENSAQYLPDPGSVRRSVGFGDAAVGFGASASGGGLVLLAFDPETMPADAAHRLEVRSNGTDVPQTTDPLASLFGLPGSLDGATYGRLSMNATVLAVYLPSLRNTDIEIQSVAAPQPGLDGPTEFAIVAAMFVVAVAAAVMFRRQDA